MTDPADRAPDPEHVTAVDLTPEAEAAVRALTGMNRPGDREPDAWAFLAALDARTAMDDAAARFAAERTRDGDFGPWHD